MFFDVVRNVDNSVNDYLHIVLYSDLATTWLSSLIIESTNANKNGIVHYTSDDHFCIICFYLIFQRRRCLWITSAFQRQYRLVLIVTQSS